MIYLAIHPQLVLDSQALYCSDKIYRRGCMQLLSLCKFVKWCRFVYFVYFSFQPKLSIVWVRSYVGDVESCGQWIRKYYFVNCIQIFIHIETQSSNEFCYPFYTNLFILPQSENTSCIPFILFIRRQYTVVSARTHTH